MGDLKWVDSIKVCKSNEEALKSVKLLDFVTRIYKKVGFIINDKNKSDIEEIYQKYFLDNKEWKSIPEIFEYFTKWKIITKKQQELLLHFLESDDFLEYKDVYIKKLGYLVKNESNEFFLAQSNEKKEITWDSFYEYIWFNLETYKNVYDVEWIKKIWEIWDKKYYSFIHNKEKGETEEKVLKDSYWIIISNEEKKKSIKLDNKFDEEIKLVWDLKNSNNSKTIMYSATDWKSVIFSSNDSGTYYETTNKIKNIKKTKKANVFAINYEDQNKKWLIFLSLTWKLLIEDFYSTDEIELYNINEKENKILIYAWYKSYIFDVEKEILEEFELNDLKHFKEKIDNIPHNTNNNISFFLDHSNTLKYFSLKNNKIEEFNSYNWKKFKKNKKIEIISDTIVKIEKYWYFIFDPKKEEFLALEKWYDYEILENNSIEEYSKKYRGGLSWLVSLYNKIAQVNDLTIDNKKVNKVYKTKEDLLDEQKIRKLLSDNWAVGGFID